MLEFLAGLPPWGLKALAWAVGLTAACLIALLGRGMFKKAAKYMPQD